jgi:hypothetical protein
VLRPACWLWQSRSGWRLCLRGNGPVAPACRRDVAAPRIGVLDLRVRDFRFHWRRMRHRFTGANFSLEDQAGNPEHETRIHRMTSTVLRTRTLWPACRSSGFSAGWRRPDALRSGGSTFGENEGHAACRGVLWAPRAGFGDHWMRASQLAERPSAHRARCEASFGMRSSGAQGSEHSAGSLAERPGLGCEARVFGETDTKSVRRLWQTAPREWQPGPSGHGGDLQAKETAPGSPVVGLFGLMNWLGFVGSDAARAEFLTENSPKRPGTRRRNVERVSPGDEPGGVLRGRKALESVEPQERQQHETRLQGVVRTKPPRV